MRFDRRQWWIIAAAGLVFALVFGVRQSQALFISPLNSATGLGIASISLAFAVAQLMWGITQPFAGAVADRNGSARVIALGGVLVTLGTVLTPHAHSTWMLILLIGVVAAGGAGMAGLGVLMSAVGRAVPPQQRGLASGIVNAGGSFGQFAVVPVAQLLTGVLGWVGALSAVGAMALAAAPLAWLLRGRPEAAPAGQRAAPEKSMRAAVRDAMRDPSFIYLTTGFFVCGFHVAFIATHLPGVVASCQLPPEVAAWSLSLIGLFNIAGSFTAGWAIGRWRMKSVLSLLYAARGLAVIAFLAAPKTTSTFIVFAVVIGFTYLATVPPTVGLVVKLHGMRFLATLVGRLGTDALAGLALVFPLVMLLQMTSAGAMGGGVSSAVARALGGGHAAAARRLVAHAAVIALGVGLAFTLLLVGFGSSLYVVLGGTDGALAQALAYSDVLFAGAVLVWLANTFASALRGSGNTAPPAIALITAALVQIPLSGALTLGWWPFPALGIRGTALAYALAFGVAALGMGLYLWSSPLRPRGSDWRLERRLFGEILRVGALSSVSALQTVLTAIILTGCVGSFGTAALAGYGVGVRLELLQVPIVFAIGQALVILVGTHIGAGRPARAKRIAWTGTLLAGGVSLSIGVSAALFPAAWVRIFSDDPDVLETGGLYLRSVAPFYALFAAGMALYFASQGAGRVGLPILAGTARLAVVAAGGLIVVQAGAPLAALFGVIAFGIALFGALTSAAVHRATWEAAATSRPSSGR